MSQCVFLADLSSVQDMKLLPGVKMQDLGTRHDVTLTTYKVIFGSMGDAENGLMLTVDLSEGEVPWWALRSTRR